ncbi:MAG: TonB-dependent receptor [Chlorobi bacterium]|nr:TonB-dependent receptor [Chlorobiota bacterium]
MNKTKLLLTVSFLLFISISIYSQVPGKISGTVKDAAGEPLPGANVMVDDYSIGASTDINGEFIILNISPGKYSVTASFVGYQSQKMVGIVVKPGLTTDLHFTLQDQSLQLDETIVITPDEELIQKDATSKVTTISADELDKLPIENLQEILSTQSNVAVLSNTPNAKAGYNERGIDDIRMRGGRSNEVALMIDGVKVSNPVFGGFGTQISKNAIRQVSIESGGYSAKYGNALSGVINLTTKEGGEKMQGTARYYTSYPADVDFLTNDRGAALRLQNFQGSLSGRVPLLRSVSYFLSSEVSASTGTTLEFDDIVWDDYRKIQVDTDGDGILETLELPTSEDIINGYLETGSLDSVQQGLSSNWKKVIGPDGRIINPLDRYRGWTGLGWNNYYNVFGKLSFPAAKSLRVIFSFLLDQRYRQFNGFNAYYDYNMPGQNVQMLNSDKQTLTISHTLSNTTFYKIRVSRFFERRKIRVLKDYENKYASWINIFSASDDNIKTPEEYIPYASGDAVYDPFERAFYMLADNRWYSGDNSTNYEFRGDFTSQFHPKYMIETGFQFNYIDLNYHSYQNVTGVDPFPTIYHYNPLEGAVYVQTKAELDNLIFNVGLRLDYLNSGGTFWSDPFDPLGDQDPTSDTVKYNPVYKVDPKWSLSPRIGIAYPLTATSVLSFNFGHFYQNPNYRDMYRASTENREISVVRGNIIGNPNLKPEKSVQYEIALQQQFMDDYVIKLNLWAKETVNQVGSVVVPAYSDPGGNNPFTYSVFVNNNLGSAKGLEINFRKRLSDNFGFNINYSYSEAKVLLPTSWDGYWSGATSDDLPKKETTAPWDQTHVIRANFQYNIPRNSGPSLFGSKILQNLDIAVFYYGNSGMPYTPTIPGGVIVEPYSARWPFSHRFDLRISKMWFAGSMKIIGLFQVKNLFDRKNVISGYTRTGSATNPGTASFYTKSSTYWDSRNNNNFGLPRTIYLGVEIHFGGGRY